MSLGDLTAAICAVRSVGNLSSRCSLQPCAAQRPPSARLLSCRTSAATVDRSARTSTSRTGTTGEETRRSASSLTASFSRPWRPGVSSPSASTTSWEPMNVVSVTCATASRRTSASKRRRK